MGWGIKPLVITADNQSGTAAYPCPKTRNTLIEIRADLRTLLSQFGA